MKGHAWLSASCINSDRRFMVAIGFQGMVDRTPSHQIKMSECHPCPRTFATYVSGLYTCAKKSTQKKAHPIARRAKPARSPVLLAPPGRCATRIAVYSAMLKQCSRTSPGGPAVLGELKGDFTIYIYIYIPRDTRYQRHDAFRKALINLSRLG